MSEATALATVGCQPNSTLRWFQDAVLPDAIATPFPPLLCPLHSGTREDRHCGREGTGQSGPAEPPSWGID